MGKLGQWAVAVAVACILTASVSRAQSEFAVAASPVHFIGVQFGVSKLAGSQNAVAYNFDNGTYREFPLNYSDVYSVPYNFTLTFGLRPPGTNFYGFGQIGYQLMGLNRSVVVPGVGTVRIFGGDANIYFARAGLATYLGSTRAMRAVPSIGAVGQIGTTKFLSSGGATALSIGPMASLDIKLSPDIEAVRYMALHTEIDYMSSLTNAWPNFIDFRVELRYFWR
jgi:hypothetical protein